MSIEQRIKIEKRIVRAAVKGLLAAGCRVGVHNGGDGLEVQPTDKQTKILAGMFQTDEEHLFVYLPLEDYSRTSVFLVYGNDGYDVINDYSMLLEPYLQEALSLSEKLEAQAA